MNLGRRAYPRKENISMELITSHVNADFDALASMVAAKKLYPQAVLALPGGAETNVREFLKLHQNIFPVKTPRDISGQPIKKIIIVDASIPSRLGDFRSLVYTPQVEVHVYDHHIKTPESMVGDVEVLKPYGATVTILLEAIKARGFNLTPTEATLLDLGLYEETGSLTFSTTTPLDIEMAAYLLRQNANLKVVASFIQIALRDKGRELLNQLVLSARHYHFHGYQVTICTGETAEYVDDLALITHRLKDLEQSEAIFSIVKMKDRVYVVGRSSGEDINVGRVLESLGGGGHSTAASGILKEDVRAIEEKIVKMLTIEVKPLLTARKIMSSPVKSLELSAESSVNDASMLMKRSGVTSLVLTQQGKPVGLVTSKDTDKALSHQLENAPVQAFASRELITIPPDLSFREITQKMIENNIGRLPVVEDGKVIGIVTRSNILRFLHRDDFPTPRMEKRCIDLIKKLPEKIQKILLVCGEIGEEMDSATYVVGGFVRDLLLTVPNFDLDIVVEGNGMAFGEKLAKRLSAKVRLHDKFQTALVILPDGLKIDIASCRTEFYSRPAALPEVTGSSIKQDLYRRDFTINTLAVKLNTRDFGHLIDFFSARRDLQSGIIRILHNLSFVDDPTRIFRAIRFEQRYQFKMDQNTENLLKSALAINIFRQLSAERIRDELIIILSEPRPLPALLRMQQLKILKLINPKVAINQKIQENLEDITSTLVEFAALVKKEKVESWMIYFAALVSPLTPDEIREIGKRFKITQNQEKKLVMEREKVKEAMRRLSDYEVRDSEIFFFLCDLSLEMLIYLLSRCKNRLSRRRLINYLNNLRKSKPLVEGRHLKEWGYQPGHPYGKWLKVLFTAQLDGEFKTLEEARAYLKKIYPKELL